VEAIFGAVLWLLANIVYWDDRRRGRDDGFRRIVAFLLGWPATFVTFLVLTEGSVPPARRDDAGLDALVDRIREDRLRRELGSAEPGPDEPGAPPSLPSQTEPE